MVTTFTPLASLAGGILIGLAAVALMAFHGRIAGATGILSGVLFGKDWDDRLWRIAMLVGMICAPALYLLATGAPVDMTVEASQGMLILSGLIVGVGVTLGSGCTSGHGVCGLARLSPRSIAATLSFMATTGITVYLIRHVFGG